MAQWINLNQNNSFVIPQQLPLLCGISGAVHLALVGLLQQVGWQADEILKICYRPKYLTFRFV